MDTHSDPQRGSTSHRLFEDAVASSMHFTTVNDEFATGNETCASCM